MQLVSALSIDPLVNRNPNLSKMTLRQHVVVGLPSLLQREDLLVNDRLEVIRLNGSDHILHLLPGADEDTPECAKVLQSIKNSGFAIGPRSTKEADDIDHSIQLDGLDTLIDRPRTADFQDLVNSHAASKLACGLTPVRVLLVIDDVVGAEFLEDLGLFSRGRSCDNSSASKLFALLSVLLILLARDWRNRSHLKSENADTTSSLHQHSLARLQWL